VHHPAPGGHVDIVPAASAHRAVPPHGRARRVCRELTLASTSRQPVIVRRPSPSRDPAPTIAGCGAPSAVDFVVDPLQLRLDCDPHKHHRSRRGCGAERSLSARPRPPVAPVIKMDLPARPSGPQLEIRSDAEVRTVAYVLQPRVVPAGAAARLRCVGCARGCRSARAPRSSRSAAQAEFREAARGGQHLLFQRTHGLVEMTRRCRREILPSFRQMFAEHGEALDRDPRPICAPRRRCRPERACFQP
jgi:hypothetical protein